MSSEHAIRARVVDYTDEEVDVAGGVEVCGYYAPMEGGGMVKLTYGTARTAVL